MEKTIKSYLRKPTDTNPNLLEILSKTSFGKDSASNTRYIIVHRGNCNFFKGQQKNNLIISGTELEMIRELSDKSLPKVPQESFQADCVNNFNMYEESKTETAYVMNLRGYDLACLSLKYSNTPLGYNVLFGQNLRDSLEKKSLTYEGMENTIRTEPEKFWFYNNGITIVTEDIDIKGHEDGKSKVIDAVILNNFSIINGAQTTSSLGRFLKNAQIESNEEDIERLKKVFVLTRILQVTNDEFRSKIAIYNNTQNRITTRDMVSIRQEQLELHNYLIKESPYIFVQIKRGSHKPSGKKFADHRSISNEELAQLAFAGFLRDPFTAKDKKAHLFDSDTREEFLVNEYYDKIFDTDRDHPGILFKKGKKGIDELLFVRYLYKLAKKDLNNIYKKRISDANKKMDAALSPEEKEIYEKNIASYDILKSICNICVFYCMSYYYAFKENFSSVDSDLYYDYDKFYTNKEFQSELIEAFRDEFLTQSIQIIKELTVNSANLNVWIRDKKSTRLFNDKVNEKIQLEMSLEKKYSDYVKKFKK